MADDKLFWGVMNSSLWKSVVWLLFIRRESQIDSSYQFVSYL